MENGWGALGIAPKDRPSERDGAAGHTPSSHDGAQQCSACLGSAQVLEHCLGRLLPVKASVTVSNLAVFGWSV